MAPDLHTSPPVSKPQRFPLTRYFVATGLLTAVIVAVPLATGAAQEVRADLIQERQALALMIASNLHRQVQLRFLAPTIAREGHVDLENPDQLGELDRLVKDTLHEFGIFRTYFFDMDGRILYASDLDHIGVTIHDNPHLAQALTGRPASVCVDREDPLDIDGEPPDQNLLESYVPVYALDAEGHPTDEQTGVIEVYQDATQLLAAVQSAMLRVAAYVVIAIVSLMLTLWLWIRKADRTIEEKADALLDANLRLGALSRDLERQVADRTKRLLQAETLATVGTLSAGVAHEVNNPIAAIASSAEGLLRRAQRSESLGADPDFADFPEYLEIIRDEAFRVKTITRNLLDFSRSGQPGAVETVDLRRLIEATARLVAHEVEHTGKRLELDLGDAPLLLEGDPAALRQLALNVTINALDVTPAGGAITWRAVGHPDRVELICEDQGPGFSAEALEHALEPFFTGKPTGIGTGLGLSICYSVVQQHGGRIRLQNLAQGGAQVIVELPTQVKEATGVQG